MLWLWPLPAHFPQVPTGSMPIKYLYFSAPILQGPQFWNLPLPRKQAGQATGLFGAIGQSGTASLCASRAMPRSHAPKHLDVSTQSRGASGAHGAVPSGVWLQGSWLGSALSGDSLSDPALGGMTWLELGAVRYRVSC